MCNKNLTRLLLSYVSCITSFYLWAEDSCTVTGYILLVALIEVTLGLVAIAAVTGAFAKGQVRTTTGVRQVTLSISQVRQCTGHPWRAVLILIRRWLKLIQGWRSSHPLDAVSWLKGSQERDKKITISICILLYVVFDVGYYLNHVKWK